VRALVTGATGFTGGHLARHLAASGHHVRILARNPARVDAGLPFDVVVGDLRDKSALEKAAEGIDVVYNIAAIYRQAGLPSETYRAVNAIAVGDLIAAASRAGVHRVVHCSTVGVHGDIEHPPANEDAPLRPGDVYQRTKVESEQRALDAAAQFGIEVTIARPSGIYGPGDRRLFKLFRNTIRRFPTLGRGEIYYHLTYIDDLVEGLRLCGEHRDAANHTYILAGGEVTTLNVLIGLIAEIAGTRPPTLHLPVWPFWLAGAMCEAACAPFGIEPPIYRRRVDFYTKSRAFDITLARKSFGYAPRVGLREGITRTLDWYRDHGWL
jgi:dihydroflavonol-4-reductase